jgi:hypothetical protein
MLCAEETTKRKTVHIFLSADNVNTEPLTPQPEIGEVSENKNVGDGHLGSIHALPLPAGSQSLFVMSRAIVSKCYKSVARCCMK